MKGFVLIVLTSLVASVSAMKSGPCANKYCRHGTTCLVKSENGQLKTICSETVPDELNKKCKIGHPILNDQNERMFCGKENKCPGDTFCTKGYRDKNRFCCWSSPDNTPKAGSCPHVTPNSENCFDFDQCGNDNDCIAHWKCCSNGCNFKHCQPPAIITATIQDLGK